MEKTVEVLLTEGTYLLPLIAGRLSELRKLVNPSHVQETQFKSLILEEMIKLEGIQHKIVHQYTEAVKAS